MSIYKLPICYYPTISVFIDDEISFLEALKDRFQEQMPMQCFHDAKQAIGFIKSQQLDKSYENFLSNSEDLFLQQKFNLNIAAIYQQIFDKDRYHKISVLVLDYTLPNLTGLDIAKQFENNHFKKILLTGDADEEIAIHAFNQGLINRYLKKASSKLTSKLEEYLNALKWEYFLEQSHTFYTAMLTDAGSNFFASDEDYFKVFSNLWHSDLYSEFYLFDESGSMLFVDKNQQTDLLIMRNKDDMKTQKEFIELSDENFPDEILDALNSNKYFLFNPLGDANDFIKNDIKNFLVKCNYSPEKRYAYHLIKNYKLNNETI